MKLNVFFTAQEFSKMVADYASDRDMIQAEAIAAHDEIGVEVRLTPIILGGDLYAEMLASACGIEANELTVLDTRKDKDGITVTMSKG
jgi:hypothetical protein